MNSHVFNFIIRCEFLIFKFYSFIFIYLFIHLDLKAPQKKTIYLFESTVYFQKSLFDSPLFESLFCDDKYIYIYMEVGIVGTDWVVTTRVVTNYSFCGVVGLFTLW